MDVANRNQTGVMDLLADHAEAAYQALPGWEDIRRVCQQREPHLKRRCLRLCIHTRESKPVHGNWAGRNVAELDQHLGRNMQHLAAPVQFQHRPSCDGM